MKIGNKKETYIHLFWLLFSIYICFVSYGFGLGNFKSPGPGCFPFGAGILLVMISILVLLKRLFKPRLKEIPFVRLTWQWPNLLLTVFSMCAYVFFLKSLGFVVCTFLLMVFSLRVVAKVRRGTTVIFALCVSLGAYLLFNKLLDTDLPSGILGF